MILVISIPLKRVWARSAAPAEAGPPVAASTVDRISAAGTAAKAPLATKAAPTAGTASPSAGQAGLQPLPGLGQPAAERRHGPAELLGRLLVGQPLEVAEHDREALAFGQAVDLLVQDGSQVVVGLETGTGRVQGGHRRCLRLFPAPLLRLDAGLDARAVGDAVQPAAQGVAAPDRAGLPGQDEEGGLKGVLDVVLVPEDGPAGGQDHRPVPSHQGLERHLVLRAGVSGQELPVPEPDDRPAPKRSRRCRNAVPNAALAMRSAPSDASRPARPSDP